jgi:predicted RNase H-like nuclease (RuvC/YqgF family)
MITIVMTHNKKFTQFRHESDTWKRYLQFIQQENNHLKTRLSQVLQHDTDEQFLERAEYFQSKFIAEDDTVNMLRQDIHELDSMLTKEMPEEASTVKELQKKLKKMHKDMEIVERQFNKLKSDFNLYLTESL